MQSGNAALGSAHTIIKLNYKWRWQSISCFHILLQVALNKTRSAAINCDCSLRSLWCVYQRHSLFCSPFERSLIFKRWQRRKSGRNSRFSKSFRPCLNSRVIRGNYKAKLSFEWTRLQLDPGNQSKLQAQLEMLKAICLVLLHISYTQSEPQAPAIVNNGGVCICITQGSCNDSPGSGSIDVRIVTVSLSFNLIVSKRQKAFSNVAITKCES